MTLARTIATLVDDLKATGYPVVVGPPFTDPPAPPCIIVGVPSITSVYAAGPSCEVAATETDVLVVGPTATGWEQLAGMVDAVVAATGGRVTAGDSEDAALADVDTIVYRLTLED